MLAPGSAVTPLAAARVLAGPVALARGPVVQGKGGAAPAVSSHLANHQGNLLRGASSVVHTPRTGAVIRAGSTVTKLTTAVVPACPVALALAPVIQRKLFPAPPVRSDLPANLDRPVVHAGVAVTMLL